MAKVPENLIHWNQTKKVSYNNLSRCIEFCPLTKKLIKKRSTRTTTKMAALNQLDAGGCEVHVKTIRQANALLKDEKARKTKNIWALRK